MGNDWEANIDTKPDGMSMEELREALARRLTTAPIPAIEHPPSLNETVEIERIPHEEEDQRQGRHAYPQAAAEVGRGAEDQDADRY